MLKRQGSNVRMINDQIKVWKVTWIYDSPIKENVEISISQIFFYFRMFKLNLA